MDKYEVYNNNLNGNNFAQVFIHKIVNDPNLPLKEKISQLRYFSSALLNIKLKIMSKNILNGVKKAHEIVIDNYEKYRKQISNAINKLQNQNKKPNANQVANSGANSGASSVASAATSQNANPVTNQNAYQAANKNANQAMTSLEISEVKGGSHKKNKKLLF